MEHRRIELRSWRLPMGLAANRNHVCPVVRCGGTAHIHVYSLSVCSEPSNCSPERAIGLAGVEPAPLSLPRYPSPLVSMVAITTTTPFAGLSRQPPFYKPLGFSSVRVGRLRFSILFPSIVSLWQGQDSNLERRFMRPTCCLYTTLR